ncbi:MAG: helix-turn-helix transcriptional regulator, partial [Ignavibacteria bacterium]|nr:helix-turn-helix transcriptional regulator [Ignavibacteria bacterium]
VAGFIQAFSGSHRYVLDYLVEEVLKHQPEHIRDFLLQTSILDSFNLSLCNAITKCEDGKEILDILDHNNLFLIALDDKRQWYRYHHLFAEVLQAHLMERHHDNVPSLHRLASRWYEQNGLPADAIRHALAAKDFDYAAGLIELTWSATEERIILTLTWLAWVKTLPEKIIHNRPVLNVCFAYALLGCGEVEAAEARLKDTEDWLDKAGIIKTQSEISSEELIIADNEQYKSLPATIAIGHAYIAQASGNIQDTVKYANLVLQLVPEDDSFRHQQASMMLGLTFWANGDLEAADQVFADYTVKLKKNGNIPDAISTTVVLADIRLTLGSLQEATDMVEKLLFFIMEQSEPVAPETADLHRELSELYLEQGN